MYLEHFGLREPPFSITPDPRFVFLSERHRDALAHLLFGIGQGGGGGFVQLTGEVGTGKTTLSRLLLEQIPQLENSVPTRVALVLNPRLSPVELLETICEELHLDIDARRGSIKALTDALNAFLLDAYGRGLRVVLIIDEAQNLSVEALEQVRLLTNLETDTQKLLQILLLGQPELRDILARPDMRQLAQRITARYHLTPLDAAETAAYLRHRYRVAGGIHLPFEPTAIRRIHAHSGGVPRLINVIAERALLGAYAHDETRIDARAVDRAAREALAPKREPGARRTWWKIAAAAGIAGLGTAAGVLAWRAPSPATTSAADAADAARPAVAATTTTKRTPEPRTVERLDADAFARRIAAGDADAASAWRALATQWQLDRSDALLAAAARCDAVVAAGMYCVRASGTLDRLVAQGRPVVLLLRDGERQAWATLRGAGATRVRLWLGDGEVDIDRLALARFWNGEFAGLWRGPDELAMPLAEGSVALGWARDRLVPRYLPVDAPATLDDALRTAVQRFQRDHGLASDGVIGPETLMALAAQDEHGPRLAELE